MGNTFDPVSYMMGKRWGPPSVSEENALKAEGFAVGQQNGENVGSDSLYYHNNAGYYAGQAAASAAQAAQTLDGYAKTNGYYEQMTVGNAEQLVSDIGVTDKVPYNFRTSGGAADIGDRETDLLVGGTLAWNQLMKQTYGQNSGTYSGVTVTKNNDGSFEFDGTATSNGSYIFINNKSVYVGHVYLISGYVKKGTNTGYIGFGGLSVDKGSGGLWKNPSYSTLNLRIDMKSGDVFDSTVMRPQLFDLTLMFGTAIADYLYTLEQSTPGAGVAWFRKLFPKAYYAYNAGELMSVQAASHATVGFNAYDNSAGTAKLLGGYQYQITGAYTGLAYTDINGDSETITPDSDGYFTPANNGTLAVTGGNGTDTCVHLVWDGERDGEFEAYSKHSYPLDDSLTLRGVPQLDADKRLYYDGDTYEADGTVTRKYGVLTGQTGAIGDTITLTGCDTAATDIITSAGHLADVGTLSGATLTLTKALSSADIVYPLAAPTTETAEPYQNPQIVDDFGTEEYADYGVASETRDVAIPVGHTTTYQANLRAKLEMAPNSPEGDGDYLVRQTNGQNVYVPLTFPADELPAAPTEDGNYVLKCTIADGAATYSWEVEA